MMILKLHISDILYLSSKTSGYAFTGDGKGNVYCVELAKKVTTPEMTEYFASDEWKEMNENDYLLYDVVNRSLDMTIESLGKQAFLSNLDAYRQALKMAEDECQTRVIPPCSADGTLNPDNNCYVRDEGCAHDCLDNLVASSRIDSVSAATEVESPMEENDKRVAWLLSFPNSGTTYTLEVIANVSNVGYATNYGKETQPEELSIFTGGKNATGPFWYPRPWDRPDTGVVLTKTHCEGRCVDCPPEQWLLTQNEFEHGCCRYARLEDVGKRKLYYDISLVDRAVHLIRNPFDNIVSRFHHERNPHFKQGARGLYDNTPAGFRKFCKERVDHLTVDPDSDDDAGDSKPLPPIDERLWNMLKGVPCHTDFVRYIRWHNLAFEMSKSKNIPSLIVHYENYGTEWNKTVTQILDFLGQHPVAEPGSAFRAKSYPDYYESSEKETVKHVFKSLSSEDSWSHIGHYFEIDTGSVDAPLCTYELLKESFPRNEDKGSEECWSLEDDILIVPLDAITNKDDMELLGTGSKGVVHKGIVRLGEDQYCSIAIKTDRCKNEKTNKRFRSCLEKDTVLMKNAQSFMEAEYMGALLFLAMKKAGIELPGLLPTYGIVSDSSPDNSDAQDNTSHWLDSTSAGILMPIIKFEAVDELWKGSKVISEKNPYEMATLMLPVIEALLFIENLGASFQDVQGKNIGIYADSQLDAFIYDNTFLALLEGETCSLEGTQKEACNFCMEDVFSTKIREPGHTTAMVRRKDCQELLSSIIRTLREYKYGNHELTIALDMLAHNGEKCEMTRIEALFQDYVASQSTPRLPFILSPTLSIEGDAAEDSLSLKIGQMNVRSTSAEYSDGTQVEFSVSNGKVMASLSIESTADEARNKSAQLNLPRQVSGFDSISAHVDKHGATTLLLDTCESSVSSIETSCFTIVESKTGCSVDTGCGDWSVVGKPNFLSLPNDCSHDACSCRADQPTLWFDKPLGKWRMLFRQYPLKVVDDQCVASPENYEFIGGYAETSGASVEGPWHYSTFDSAYSTLVKTSMGKSDGPIDQVKNYPYRSLPQVILSEQGGLDGGYLMTNVCDLKNDGSDQCIRDGWIVQQVWQSVVWSKEASKVHALSQEAEGIVAPYTIQGPWDNLPEEIKNAWTVLGQTKDLWDEGEEPDYKGWEELTLDERIAAHQLGFERSSWESSD